tara:strand:+ start:67 stop:249 length:183 start_codon:yes stop_codon:yes gene_type:complete
MTKVRYFQMKGENYYKEIVKPTGRYMLSSDWENGQDEVEIHSQRVVKVSKDEFLKNRGHQ